jgi:hypothetical protein
MSLKVNTFASIITNPLNIHNFVVEIPEAANASIVVASTQFPSEKLQKVVLHYQGEEVRYPTIPKNDGVWKVKVPETDSGAIKKELDALKSAVYSQKTGIFTPSRWKDVKVTARDLEGNIVFSSILHGAWLVGRDPVELNNSDPSKNWEWDYEFCYQWIEDDTAEVDGQNQGSANPLGE